MAEYVFGFTGILAIGALIKDYLFKPTQIKIQKPKNYDPNIEIYEDSQIDSSNLEKFLLSKVQDQRIAIKMVTNTIVRASTIWNNQEKLLNCLLFIGPNDCGKVYLSKQIARSQKRPFIFYDMEQYQNDSNLDYLIQKMILNFETFPNSIVVFNQFNLLSPNGFLYIKEILDQGEIIINKDGDKEKIIDLKNLIFIFNIDSNDEIVNDVLNSNYEKDNTELTIEDLMDRMSLLRSIIIPLIVKYLKVPREILTRCNSIVPFFYFSNIELANDLLNLLNLLNEKGKKLKKIKLEWSEGVLIWLMKRYRQNIPLTSLIENHILNLLAFHDKEIKEGERVNLTIVKDKIVVKFPDRDYFQFDRMKSKL